MAKRTINKVSTDELQAELARREKAAQRLATKREKLISQIADIDAELASWGYEAVGGPSPSSGGRRRGSGRKRPRNDMNLVDTLAKALKGKTMSVTEAADAARKLGYKSSSDNFRNIVNQTLLKHKDAFKKVERGQYTAK